MALTRKCAEAEMISRRSPAWRCVPGSAGVGVDARRYDPRDEILDAPAISAGVRPAMGARLKSM